MEKFLFETSFDSEADRRSEAEAPPTFSQDELVATREIAFAEGEAAGRAAAAQATEARIEDQLRAMDGQLQAMFAAMDDVRNKTRDDSLRVLRAIATRLLPRHAARHGLDEIVGVADQCLDMALQEPAIVVRCNGTILDEVKARVEALAQGRAYEGKLIFIGEDHIAMDGCAIEWADGGVVRAPAEIMSAIDALIAASVDDDGSDDGSDDGGAAGPDADPQPETPPAPAPDAEASAEAGPTATDDHAAAADGRPIDNLTVDDVRKAAAG